MIASLCPVRARAETDDHSVVDGHLRVVGQLRQVAIEDPNQ
jgi:hypothetical protein